MHINQINCPIPQAVPMVGPVLVSPVIALANAIKMVAGAFFLTAGLVQRIATGNNNLQNRGVELLKSGALNFAFSLGNIATLGLSGFTFLVVSTGKLAAEALSH